MKDSSLLKQGLFFFNSRNALGLTNDFTYFVTTNETSNCLYFLFNFFCKILPFNLMQFWLWCCFMCHISGYGFRFAFTNWFTTFPLKVKSLRFVKLVVFSKLPSGFEMLLIPSIRLKQYLLQIACNSTNY